MNKIILSGRLTQDPEMRKTQSGAEMATFNLAVNRKRDHNTTDFFHCFCRRIVFFCRCDSLLRRLLHILRRRQEFRAVCTGSIRAFRRVIRLSRCCRTGSVLPQRGRRGLAGADRLAGVLSVSGAPGQAQAEGDHQPSQCFFHGSTSCRAGKVTKNRLPSPGVLSTEMRPPCWRMIWSHMARPNPSPPDFRARAPSTW